MADDQALTTPHASLIPAPDFDQLVEMIAPTTGEGMVAASSARVYRDTYRRWRKWATQNQVDPLAVRYSHVAAFLTDLGGSKTSRQRALSALRKLAETLSVVDYMNPERRAALESLRLLKVRHLPESSAGAERERRALTPKEAQKLLDVWAESTSVKGRRDYAIIATLLLTGLRRAELAALQWKNIDFASGVIRIRHGKGDKDREVAIYSDTALDALRAWQLEQPRGYQYVFTRLCKGGHFIDDKPMDTTSIWRVVERAAQEARIGHVKPHDLRRTLATELLVQGDAVHNVQAQLGHAHSSTTLDNYAVSVSARQRRQKGRLLRYG